MTRKATLTGSAFTVLLAAAVLTMQNFSFMPSQAEAIGFFEDRGRLITWGAFFGGIACFCLIWFGALLAHRLQSNAFPIAAGAALGGSVFAAVATGLGFMFLAAGAERTVLGGGIPPEVAAILYDLASVSVGNAAPFGFALLTAAVVISGREHFPNWFIWASGVLTIGLISPVNYAVVALTLVWIPVSGIWLDQIVEKETV
jgi:hypothetical protein